MTQPVRPTLALHVKQALAELAEWTELSDDARRTARSVILAFKIAQKTDEKQGRIAVAQSMIRKCLDGDNPEGKDLLTYETRRGVKVGGMILKAIGNHLNGRPMYS